MPRRQHLLTARALLAAEPAERPELLGELLVEADSVADLARECAETALAAIELAEWALRSVATLTNQSVGLDDRSAFMLAVDHGIERLTARYPE